MLNTHIQDKTGINFKIRIHWDGLKMMMSSLFVLTLFPMSTNAKGLIGTIGISGNARPGLVGRTYGTLTTEVVAIVLGVLLSILALVSTVNKSLYTN